MKKLCVFAFIFILFLGIAFALSSFLRHNLRPVGGDEKSVQIVVPVGGTVRRIANQLQAEGLIRSEEIFYYYARHKKSLIKAGTYRVSTNMNADEILALLETGKQEHIVVSVPEGYTIRKIAAMLETRGICSSDDFIVAAKDKQGFLFHDTYFFTQGMDAEKVVKMMLDAFTVHIRDIPELADAKTEEVFRIVTLASIIEREYRRPEEAPLIASVFTNRLQNNIGLYSCATIEYIITEINGLPHPDIITYDDLEIDSRYNTYKHRGLPPGPISNPGMVALRAAANPAKTDYYYFRVVDNANGTHHFSNDLDEHIYAGTTLYTKKAAGL
jgi:UPF0755 protein